MLYCHSDFTRCALHAAWMAISPWFKQMVQYTMFASHHFLLNLPPSGQVLSNELLFLKSHKCQWSNFITWTGMGPLNWTWALVDHWEIPYTSVVTTNLHEGFFQIMAWAFINAFLCSSTTGVLEDMGQSFLELLVPGALVVNDLFHPRGTWIHQYLDWPGNCLGSAAAWVSLPRPRNWSALTSSNGDSTNGDWVISSTLSLSYSADLEVLPL